MLRSGKGNGLWRGQDSPLSIVVFDVDSAVTHVGSFLGLCNVKARLGDATSGAKDRSDLEDQERETRLNTSLLLLLLLLPLLKFTGLDQVVAVERHLRQTLSFQPLKCISTVPVT